MQSLPQSYDEDCLGVLVQDPYQLFAYWELTEGTRRKALQTWNLGVYAPCQLRVQRLSGDEDGITRETVYQAELPPGADHWYVSGVTPGQVYRVQIGVQCGPKSFGVLLNANPVHTPPVDGASSRGWGRATAISGGVDPVKTPELPGYTYSSLDIQQGCRLLKGGAGGED